MLHLLLISIFVVMFVRDSMTGPLFGGHRPLPVAIASVASMAVLAAVTHLLIWRQARRMDRGRYRAVYRADQIAAGSRLCAAALHGYLVLGLGWLDAVRAFTGDVIVLDEILAALPVLGAFILGWWSMYAIDNRVREAILIQELDQGHPIRPLPTRTEYVVSALRHQAALILVPILALMTWKELLERFFPRLGLPVGVPMELVQIAGMIVILTFLPLLMRWIWDTTRLGPGPLRDRLESMCRAHRVRIRDLLVWRTHGTMINGAVMGLAGPLRYILLTDALLELLPQAQVEAVTAHELGHVRRRHIPWLAAAIVSSIAITFLAGHFALQLSGPALANSQWAAAAVSVASMILSLVLFGIVSRRFEWQADAFAVQHLSGYHRGSAGATILTPEAVAAMSGALGSVARLNHVPLNRFSWRHGSIASRQRRLGELVGRRADNVRADRNAGIVKISAAIGLLATGLLAAASGVSSASQHTEQRADEVRQDARHR